MVSAGIFAQFNSILYIKKIPELYMVKSKNKLKFIIENNFNIKKSTNQLLSHHN